MLWQLTCAKPKPRAFTVMLPLRTEEAPVALVGAFRCLHLQRFAQKSEFHPRLRVRALFDTQTAERRQGSGVQKTLL